MAKEISIDADLREQVGKGSARQTRIAGRIPAVVYGPEIDPVAISVDSKAFRAAVKEAGGSSAVYDLNVGGKASKVLIRDIQRDPVTSVVTHVDFHAISMNKEIHISVPIHFTGTPFGVKTEGGIMQTTLRELDVACLPKDIPEQVLIDVSELKIGESVHVGNLEIPNARVLTEAGRTIVVISAPTVLKSTAAEGEEAEGEELAEGEEGAEAAAEGEGAEGEAKAKAEEKKEG